MKKNFKYYMIAWGLLIALFNLITFIIPGDSKFTNSFWCGYVFIMVSFVGQLVCSLMVFKQDEHRKAFWNINLLCSSVIGLAMSFIAGAICMIVAFPYWISIIICAIVLVINILALVKARVAVDVVESVDKKLKEKTFFIKSLTVDAETLMESVKSASVKAECRKVVEVIKYSDPMSNDALSSVEGQIALKFADFSDAVKADDAEKVASLAKEIVVLVGDRNRKCRLLK